MSTADAHSFNRRLEYALMLLSTVGGIVIIVTLLATQKEKASAVRRTSSPEMASLSLSFSRLLTCPGTVLMRTGIRLWRRGQHHRLAQHGPRMAHRSLAVPIRLHRL